DPVSAVRPLRRDAEARRMALHWPFRESAQRDRSLRSGRTHGLPQDQVMSLGTQKLQVAKTGHASGPEGPRRYRDPMFGEEAIKVFPGEHYVSDRSDEMLVTILGSCVAACIRDPRAGVGGMNHFMLPESGSGGSGWDSASSSMRYGNVAMERLINDVLARGGMRKRL